METGEGDSARPTHRKREELDFSPNTLVSCGKVYSGSSMLCLAVGQMPKSAVGSIPHSSCSYAQY